MAVNGFWQSNKAVSVEHLNATLLQKGNHQTFDNTLTGMVVWNNGDSKVYYANGSGWDVAVDVDAAAATPSLRSLGATSTTAAAGDHGHVPSQVVTDVASNSPAAVGTNSFTSDLYEISTTEVVLINDHNFGNSGSVNAIVLSGTLLRSPFNTSDTLTHRLYEDNVQIASVSGSGGILGNVPEALEVQATRDYTSSHTYDLRAITDAGTHRCYEGSQATTENPRLRGVVVKA